MAELTAPQQNRLLGQLANMLRATEGDIAAPEFLPRQLDVMGLVRQLMLPSAETVEKMSYGDPLFRMPMQSNIPITADREYLADIAGMIPFGAPAARPTARGIQDLVRQIQTEPPMGAVTLRGKPSIQNLLPETGDEISAIADQITEQAKAAGFRVKPGYSNVSGSQYVTIEKPVGEDEFKTVQVRVSNHGDRYPGTAEGTRFSIDPSSRNTYEDAISFLADEGFDITKPITKEAITFEQYVRNLGLDPSSLTPEQLDTLQFTARRDGISVGGLLDKPAQSVNLQSIVEKAQSKNIDLQVSESGNLIDVGLIKVPKRGKGLGTEAMQDLIDYADQTGKQIRLIPDPNIAKNVDPERLVSFYERLGFQKQEPIAGETVPGSSFRKYSPTYWLYSPK